MNAESKSKSKRNRMFEACVLLMMAVLAVCTVTFTTLAEEDNGSYSLIIKKVFEFTDEIPEEVRTTVQEKEYKFLISGTRREGDQTIEVNRTFTLPRIVDGSPVWESEVYKSNGPFNVTVTELTDNVDVRDNKGRHYNMSDSTTDTGVMVNNRKHEVELKNNSILTIERPQDNGPDQLWYRVTNRPYDNHSSGNFKALDKVFCLEKGQSERITRIPSSSGLGSRLCAAIYTIEQIAAPEGYQLQLGSRTETVSDGNVGHFHINGTPGKLTLTAGGVENDGVLHVFNIDRTETTKGDTSEFVPRDVRIASGETYVFDNLPKGGYTVTEQSFPEDVNAEFSVVMPQTTSQIKNGKSTAPQYNTFRIFNLTPGTTYFKLNSYGPIYDVNDKKISDTSVTYELAYGWGNEKGGVTYSTLSGTQNGKSTYTMTSSMARYPAPTNLTIGFRTKMLTNPNSKAKKLGVSWTEYTEKNVPVTFAEAGTTYKNKIKVDSRGWMTITAPAPKEGSDASQIVYYYKLEKGTNLITGVGGETDKPDTTVMLRAGESVKLEGLDEGSYKITETVEWDYAGFTMQVEGYPFGTTEAGRAIDVQVGGQRELKISKPAVNNPPEGAADEREYTFDVSGSGFYETVSMKAGETRTVTLPSREGSYTISPGSDALAGYKMKYTDSGAIYGTASGSQSSITFTNVFRAGEYGYRFVHEYYVKEADGAYVYEGNSPIATRLGRNEGEQYQSGEIDKVSTFNSNQYSHFDEAYGWVDPLTLTASAQSDSDRKTLKDIADGDETEASDDDETETSDDDSSDTDEGEEAQPSDDDSSDTDDGDETQPSDDDSSDTDEGDEAQPSDDDSSDTDEGDGTQPSDDNSSGTGDGNRAEIPDDDTSDIDDGNGTGSSGEGVLHLIDDKETRDDGVNTLSYAGIKVADSSSEGISDPADGAETGTSGEDGSKPVDGAETGTPGEEGSNPAEGGATGSPGEDSSNPADGDNTETPGEDGSGPADGEEVSPPTEDGSNPAEGEDTETPGEDGSDPVDGDDTETPGEDGSNSAEGEDTETPGEDSSDPADGDNVETSGEDDLDFVDGVDKESPEKDTSKALNKKEEINSSRTLFAQAYDGTGIIDQGVGKDSEGNPLNYKPESDKDYITVTEEADQIIILRYFRERQPEGKYNVIHVYYRRDKDGDHWEGTSGVRPQSGELGIKYSGNQVEKETRFKPEDASVPYDYIWDGRPQYGVVEETGNTGSSDSEFAGDGMVYRPNNAWKEVEGTEEGNQIIILRYYRDPNREGYYNIVHEYYFREKGGGDNQGHGRSAQALNEDPETGEDEVSEAFSGTLNQNDGYVYTYEGGHTNIKSVTALLGTVHTAAVNDQKPEYGGNTYTYIDAGYGDVSDQRDSYSYDPNQQWAAATAEGDEVIILRYYRKAGYKVVHEYYVREKKDAEPKLVGKSGITTVSDVSDEEPYTQEDVSRIPEFQGETYTYFDCGYGTVSGEDYRVDSGKVYVEATGSEEQIIILRYVLEKESEEPDKPDPPEEPDPPDKPDPPEEPDPPDKPDPPEEPDPPDKPDPPEEPDPPDKPDPPEEPDPPDKPDPPKEPDPPKKPNPPAEQPRPQDPNPSTQLSPPSDPESPAVLPTPKAQDASPALLVPLTMDVPENTAEVKSSVPKTGDDNRTVLWLLLVAGALCGLAGLSLHGYVDRKRKGERTDQQ